jgi:hypothetical protein
MITATSPYQLAEVSMQQEPVFLIQIQGYSRTFSNKLTDALGNTITAAVGSDPWLVSIDDLAITVSDLEGGAELADLVFHVQDRGQAITADLATFTFEGKTVTLLQGYPSLALVDYVTLFTGKIDSVSSDNENNEYQFTCPDIRTELSKVVFGTGESGKPTDQNNPRTVVGHPLDILLLVLETEVGLSPTDVDVTTITTYRDGLYSGVEFSFYITSPPAAKEFIENELLKPLGAFLWTNNLGQVTVTFFYPLSTMTVFDFDIDNMTEIPIAEQADLINEVSVRYDADTSDKFQRELVRAYSPSVSLYGLYGQHIIESKGLKSAFQGTYIAALVAYLIFLRYGMKNLMFGDGNNSSGGGPVSAIWAAARLEPGDLVTVTEPHVPNRTAGTLGIVGETFIVLDRTWQFMEATVQLKLLSIDLSKFKQYLITSNAEPAYTSASAGHKTTYMYQCNNSDQYSNGDPGNTLA